MFGSWVSDGRTLLLGSVVVACVLSSPSASAQLARASTTDVDSLVSRAVAVSPTILAARRRIDAARARVGPAGARPDPILMAGIQNQPLGREAPMVSAHGVTSAARDPMTMHMLGISQTIPYPGKLALRTQAAERDVDAATAAFDAAQLDVVRDVRTAYYELAYLDEALHVTQENQSVLSSLIQVTESHYAVGSGMQQDVLKARLGIAQLAQNANGLREQRRAQLAALNALLDRASDTPVDGTQGTGADVMKRIAAPMVGGMLTSTILTLAVIPVVYSLWKERRLPRTRGSEHE